MAATDGRPQRPLDGRSLRVVVIGGAIVSDIGHPAASSYRAIVASLLERGHQVRFFEHRPNVPFDRLVRTRGAGAVRRFAERFASLDLITYAVQGGHAARTLLMREAATADLLLLTADAPADVHIELERCDVGRVLVMREIMVATSSRELPWTSLLEPVDTGERIPFTPAISVEQSVLPPADELVIVRYGGTAMLAEHLAAIFPTAARLDAGAELLGDEWDFVPEVDLRDRYATVRRAIILDDDPDPRSRARVLLPLGMGVDAVRVGRRTAGDDAGRPLLVEIAALAKGWPTDQANDRLQLAARHDAADIAAGLEQAAIARSLTR